MADDDRPAHWWQTIPGVLTAFAAVITAVTGLLVVLRPASAPPERPSSSVASVASDAGSAVLPAATPATPRDSRAVILPTPPELKLADGAVVLRFLSARLEPYNPETRSLILTVRYTNNGHYPANFWDRSFRLLIDDVPRAPTGNLNKVVDSQSADEGDVVFQVPVSATRVTLRIISGDEHTDVPLDLK